jgi:tetrahydromethanopterin S-methyltransferase subunit B
MRDGARHSPPLQGAEPPATTRIPRTVDNVVRLEVAADGRVRVDVPAGWCLPERLRRDLDALKPDLLRALAPDLPPVGSWPPSWCELFEERAGAAAEAGAVDPLAAAEADLRLAVWRGDVEGLPVDAA